MSGMMNQDKFLNFEEQLQSILYPVNPDQRFIDELDSRLSTPQRVFLAEHSSKLTVLLIGLGLFAGVFLVWMIRKVLKP